MLYLFNNQQIKLLHKISQVDCKETTHRRIDSQDMQNFKEKFLIIFFKQIQKTVDIVTSFHLTERNINKFNVISRNMINCIKNKSFSYTQLKSDISNSQKQPHPYFLYRVGASHPVNQVLVTKIQHPTHKNSPNNNSPLQIFKTRLSRGLKDIRQAQNSRQTGEKSKFCNIKINDMMLEAESQSISFKRSNCQSTEGVQQHSPISRKTIFRYFNELICPNKAKQRLSKIEVRGREDGSNSSTDELTFTKSNSIMIVRKVNKNKDRFVQNRKDKYEEEFHRIKEVPIHHTQHHLSKRGRVKTEGIASKYRQAVNNNNNTQNAINDILRETMRESQLWQMRKLEVCIRGNSNGNLITGPKKTKIDTKKVNNHSDNKLVEKSMYRSKFVKNMRDLSAKKEEIGQFGPWMRKKTNDMDFLF